MSYVIYVGVCLLLFYIFASYNNSKNARRLRYRRSIAANQKFRNRKLKWQQQKDERRAAHYAKKR